MRNKIVCALLFSTGAIAALPASAVTCPGYVAFSSGTADDKKADELADLRTGLTGLKAVVSRMPIAVRHAGHIKHSRDSQ